MWTQEFVKTLIIRLEKFIATHYKCIENQRSVQRNVNDAENVLVLIRSLAGISLRMETRSSAPESTDGRWREERRRKSRWTKWRMHPSTGLVQTDSCPWTSSSRNTSTTDHRNINTMSSDRQYMTLLTMNPSKSKKSQGTIFKIHNGT